MECVNKIVQQMKKVNENRIISINKNKDQTVKGLQTVQTQTKTTNETKKSDSKNGKSCDTLKINSRSLLHNPFSLTPCIQKSQKYRSSIRHK